MWLPALLPFEPSHDRNRSGPQSRAPYCLTRRCSCSTLTRDSAGNRSISSGPICIFGRAGRHFLTCSTRFPSSFAACCLPDVSAVNGLFVLFGSMLLHFACDLPLHHDDAHRHFLPLSLWRFESPVSYWDPKRFGWITAPLEMILTVGGCVYLSWRPSPPGVRFVAGSILGIYALFVCFAIWMWAW